MKLYKYLSNPEWIEKILETEEFYFSDWRKLNDPMEGFFRYFPDYHSREDIDKIVRMKELWKICCFSLTYKEVLMWSHYAKNHEGICVEIDIDDERNNAITFEPIEYIPRIGILKNKTPNIDSKQLLSRKIQNWKYEKEIRAFFDSTEEGTQKVGKITKVILGLQCDARIESISKNSSLRTAKAKMDFDNSEIKIVRS